MNRNSHPVEWALFLDELDAAREHLEDDVRDLHQAGHYEEEDLRVNLGHIDAHLNRAWHSRNHVGKSNDDLPSAFSRFPDDVEPVG